jgi:serine/threonine protein phosphatase PrpC
VIAETLARDATLEQKCQSLIQTARATGGPDNITAVLIRSVE